MGRTITLELSDNAYEALLRRSADLGRGPEQFASEFLDDSLLDPLLQLAGCLTAAGQNVADAHDDAFGNPNRDAPGID